MTPQDFLVVPVRARARERLPVGAVPRDRVPRGLKDPRYLDRVHTTDEERARLERRLAEPSLWDAYTSLLAQHGDPDLTDVLLDRDQLRPAVRGVRGPPRSRPGVRAVAGAAHDDGRAPDRGRPGTGGSTGAALSAQHRSTAASSPSSGPSATASEASVALCVDARRGLGLLDGSRGRIARSSARPDRLAEG